tara:strand:+ start:523 stop:891 length:369 start_codon:yes stop_codon:yes gene_type:complete
LGNNLKKDEEENYVKEGSERDKKTLADLIDDIYKKIYFLKEELTDLKEHTIKLTLQGNKMHQILNDKKKDNVSKIKELKEFDKDYFLESLITFMSKDKDFEDLQKILDKYEDELLTEQYGDS